MDNSKKDLLKEIRYQTQKNNNKTPSAEKFFKETGLKLYQLHKSGFSNYGKLVKAAGLTPNKFDKTKYTQEELCISFINVIREKKRWPTKGELDVKHHQNSSFPESGTFYNRLGLANNLAGNLLDFIKYKKGYDDIYKICTDVLSKNNCEANVPSLEKGYVYLLKSKLVNSVAYKIGKTNNIENRKKQLRQPSNVEEIIHVIETDDAVGVEKYWLDRFKSKRLYPEKVRDEWFILSSSDVKAFKSWRRIF